MIVTNNVFSDSKMSETKDMSLIRTEAHIWDNDLHQTYETIDGRQRYKKMSFVGSAESDDENEINFDDNCDEEKQLMISLGLPTHFNSNRIMNKRSKKKTIKTKHKTCYPLNATEEVNHWSQTAIDSSSEEYPNYESIDKNEELMNESLNKLSQNLCDIKSSDENDLELSRSVIECIQELDISSKVVDNSVISDEEKDSDGSDSCDRQQPKEDNSRHESKETNTQNSEQLTSGLTSGLSSILMANTFLNNGSDGEEPPEERPITIKRQHESDFMDLNEDKCVDEIESKDIEDVKNSNKREVCNRNKRQKSLKYWHQRYRLFSRFDEGIQLDVESWYSVTPERIAQHIAHRFTLNGIDIIVDAFCGCGGNTIQFAMISENIKVIAIDIDLKKINFAKQNAKIYGVDHRIQFICADYMVLAKTAALKADAVFLSPPWGGPEYLQEDNYTLDMMSPNGAHVFEVTNANITPNIGILLPRNIDTNELQGLAGSGNSVELEQNLLNKKIKTMTAYFGQLIRNSSDH